MLAEETGGKLYEVRDLKDLNGAYDQVINDLSRVYSLGYEPKNESRDGDWRDLTVTVVGSQPGLVARTRRGYYAK
jgi:VWFA-related protein